MHHQNSGYGSGRYSDISRFADWTRITQARPLYLKECSDNGAMIQREGTRIGAFKAFIQYFPNNPTVPIQSNLKQGWKLHVAISDEGLEEMAGNQINFDQYDESNLGRGWNIVKDAIDRYGIMQSKVVVPGTRLHEHERQHGKQITIYYFFQPGLNWQQIIQDIEDGLNNAQIRPDNMAQTDTRIQGAQFVSYRYEAINENLEHQENEQVPENDPNPFVNIQVHPNVEHENNNTLAILPVVAVDRGEAVEQAGLQAEEVEVVTNNRRFGCCILT